MMSVFAYVLVDLIHFAKIIFLCDMYLKFDTRNEKYKKFVIGIEVICMSVISIFTYYCKNEGLVLFISILAVSGLVFTLYKEKFINVIVAVTWITFTVSMIDTMSTVMSDLIANLIGLVNDSVIRLGASVVSLVFIFIVGKMYCKKYDNGIKTIGIKNLFLFTLLALVDAVIITVSAYITINESPGEHRILYSVSFILVIIGMYIQLGAVILLFMQRNVLQEKKQITEKYLNEQISHYEYLEKRETETKKFRHDLRNHMQVISDLAHNGEYEKIEHYLDVMNMKIENFGNLVTVQHGIVDSIINKYYSLALQSGISMNIKGIFPKECSIEPYDLCTIFSNVLSNALEATIEADEKVINLECRYNDKNIIIVVSNTYKDVGQFDGEKIKTRKDDIDYHGYGLTNIRESIQKHSGVLDIETKNGVFTISLMLNYVGNEVV